MWGGGVADQGFYAVEQRVLSTHLNLLAPPLHRPGGAVLDTAAERVSESERGKEGGGVAASQLSPVAA